MKLTITINYSLDALKEAVKKYYNIEKATKKDVISLISSLAEADIQDIFHEED